MLLGLGPNTQCVLLVKILEVLCTWSVHFADIRSIVISNLQIESILQLDSQWEERLHWKAVRSGKQLLLFHFSNLKHAVMSPSSWFPCDFSLLSSPNLNTYVSHDIGSAAYIRLPQVVIAKDSNSSNIWLYPALQGLNSYFLYMKVYKVSVIYNIHQNSTYFQRSHKQVYLLFLNIYQASFSNGQVCTFISD